MKNCFFTTETSEITERKPLRALRSLRLNIFQVRYGRTMFKSKKYLLLALILVVILISLSCAPGNYRWNPNVQGSKPANFWAGLWHGIND